MWEAEELLTEVGNVGICVKQVCQDYDVGTLTGPYDSLDACKAQGPHLLTERHGAP